MATNDQQYPATWAGLRFPWVRRELILYLEELSASDPRPRWKSETAEGLISGIDQVIHFFFDDHDFDASAIGICLLDQEDVDRVASVRLALDRILADLPCGEDDDYVEHPLWPRVTLAARAAYARIATQ